MRLRTAIALAFIALSVLQVVVVVPFALSNLNDLLSKQQDARIDRVMDAVAASLERTRADVDHAVHELSQSPAIEEVAKGVKEATFRPDRKSAEELMAPRRLNVLSVLDERGRTLLSGHNPGRLGDPDQALHSVTAAPGAPSILLVEVQDDAGPRRVPALVSARPFDYGERRIWAVGGVKLDAQVAEYLAKLSGARAEVRVLGESEAVAAAGEAEPPSVERVLPLAPVAELRLSFSRSELLAAGAEVLRAFFLFFTIGLTLAVLSGLLISRRITRPVEALTQAASKVSAGSWDAKVEVRASGEVGALVEAFNRMTADLRRTTQKLVASERVAAWQEVARRLAHELKNPLTPIKMSLETLMAASAEGSPKFSGLFKESAGAMLEEVERLRRIVDEFSRFARLPKPQLSRADLSELAAQVLSLYAAPRDGVALSSKLEPNVLVEADRDQLTQVLLNLVKNAEEAMPSGGRVEVRVRRAGAEAVLEVEDQGQGVRPEDRSRIFEPYFTTKQGGTGLGLAIAARICQEHGGRLEVGGEVGRGAIFSVVLPARAGGARTESS
ncbi:MAG: HAMP domain-containing protein [Myxococcales bacterium]|nr:HAMP domain-containing protein [Myxococcales bacterium]